MDRRISNRRSIVRAWNFLGHVAMALVSPSNSKNHTRSIPVSSIAVIDFAVEEKTLSSESDPEKKEAGQAEMKHSNSDELLCKQDSS